MHLHFNIHFRSYEHCHQKAALTPILKHRYITFGKMLFFNILGGQKSSILDIHKHDYSVEYKFSLRWSLSLGHSVHCVGINRTECWEQDRIFLTCLFCVCYCTFGPMEIILHVHKVAKTSYRPHYSRVSSSSKTVDNGWQRQIQEICVLQFFQGALDLNWLINFQDMQLFRWGQTEWINQFGNKQLCLWNQQNNLQYKGWISQCVSRITHIWLRIWL